MPSILIIEDDDPLRKKLEQIFSKEKYEVSSASNGQEGLKFFREKPCDVILTDIIMPEKDGLETVIDLTKEFDNLKIIAMSGGGRDGYDGYLHLAQGLGAKRIIKKPFSIDELLNLVQEVLDE